jgi:pimeloyl-ACP methyl ester carboxylesterase
MSVRPFRIDVSEETIDDLRRRLAATRWPDEVEGAGWDYGTNLAELRRLTDHWRDGFDWPAQQAALNRLDHFRAEVDGLGIHLVHQRGRGDRPLPLLLLHGWPSSFLQMVKILPLLTDPAAHGGDPADAFDVVVPSLPGYGFSDRPARKGMSARAIAGLLSTLMTTELGYPRYGVRASDLGSGVAAALPRRQLVGLHQSGTNPFVQDVPADLSPEEQEFLDRLQAWLRQEFAYAQEHTTKPQTLAYGLNDSPAGLAAWVLEKFRAWSDCGGDLERRFSRDELLTNLTIYWATETIGSSMRLYYESMRDWGQPEDAEARVPSAVAMFPADMVPTPRSWAERQGPVDRWTDMPRGGHFGEWEEPELLAGDLRAFFRPLR